MALGSARSYGVAVAYPIIVLGTCAIASLGFGAAGADTGLPRQRVRYGGIWGVLRDVSGSLVVSSVSHGVWNGLAYTVFGYGTRAGALGIRQVGIYGPEVGLLGLALNTIVLLAVAKTLIKSEPNADTLYFSA